MTDDLLWRQIKAMPAFRGLLRAVEAKFYDDLPLPEPTLDLGCGDGHFASETFGRPLSAGADPWWRPLKEARDRRAYLVSAQADGARLPFPTGYFACAVSNSVLEHIPDVESVLVDLNRVLQPGARFIFCSPSEHFLEFLSISRFLRRVGLRPLAETYERFFNRISRHHHCDSPQVWRERLGRAGFDVERCWYYFSPGAHRALEWGHYLGLPSAICKALFGRWILWPSRANLWLTEKLLRRYYEEGEQEKGAYVFFVTRKVS
ncbi:MAG: methyltransferase domain-containing protein [Chloroflexi bacterium]|nr:methyltransferase domain-containing protein [Chloroflexota bacterium]